jgi:hypothetical protein
MFFYLYLIVDVWSRKIVSATVRLEESAECTRDVIAQAIEAEAVDRGKLVLHADNSGPVNGSTLLAILQRLGGPSAAPPSATTTRSHELGSVP